MVFEVLWLDGQRPTGHTYEQRHALLAELPLTGPVRVPPAWPGTAAEQAGMGEAPAPVAWGPVQFMYHWNVPIGEYRCRQRCITACPTLWRSCVRP